MCVVAVEVWEVVPLVHCCTHALSVCSSRRGRVVVFPLGRRKRVGREKHLLLMDPAAAFCCTVFFYLYLVDTDCAGMLLHGMCSIANEYK